MAIKVWNASGLTGGTAGKLDSLSIAVLANGHRAHVVDSGKFYFYVYNATGTAAENSPLVIRPDDYTSGGNWELASSPYGDLAIMPELVSGLPIQGSITGGNITVSGNTLTITPTTCLDSTLSAQLYTTTDKTCVIPSVANTVYHIFLVRILADASMEFRAYTTEAAVASDAQVDKYRWIGLWKTNGANACYPGVMVDGCLMFDLPQIVGTHTTGNATYDFSTLFPVSRISKTYVNVRGTHSSGDYTTTSVYKHSGSTTYPIAILGYYAGTSHSFVTTRNGVYLSGENDTVITLEGFDLRR